MYGNNGYGGDTYPPDPRSFPPRASYGQATQRTAIMDLDAFLAGLSSDDRSAVINSREFSMANAEFMQGFIAFLLAGDPGRAFLNAGAKEPAERLLLLAKDIHAKTKEQSRSEVDNLKKELADLKSRLGEGE